MNRPFLLVVGLLILVAAGYAVLKYTVFAERTGRHRPRKSRPTSPIRPSGR